MENNIENTNNRENIDGMEQVTPSDNTASHENTAGAPAYADVKINARNPKKISLLKLKSMSLQQNNSTLVTHQNLMRCVLKLSC